jgi:CDGSH-type Zn-finger protein
VATPPPEPRAGDSPPVEPVLVEGPVDMVLPDGTAVRSQRPMVAICACRRSKHYPFCDTSHRERSRPGSSSDD